MRGGGYALHDSREVTAEEQKWSLAELGYLHCLMTVCLRSRLGSSLRPHTHHLHLRALRGHGAGDAEDA